MIYREVYTFCRRVENYAFFIDEERFEIVYFHVFEIMHCIDN